MPNVIWNDLYFHLWSEAAQSRGTVTQFHQVPGADGLAAIPEWPRTTGADVIATASLIDPILGSLALRPGGYGVTHLWQNAMIELEGSAFTAPAAEYPHNRSWWSAFLAITSYLDSRGAPLPADEHIERLIGQFWSPTEHRNDAAPSHAFDAGDADKMWEQQRDLYAKQRGFDIREASETGSLKLKIPRTTNADVIRLYQYWTAELLRFFTGGGLFGANTMGLQGQMARWNTIRDAVDVARDGKPDDTYGKNAELWAETLRLASNLSVWHQVPSTFSLVVDATTQAIKDVPKTIVEDIPHTIGVITSTVARAASNVAREVGAGLLSGFGKPLLIGGGAALLVLIIALHYGRNTPALPLAMVA